MTNAFTALWQDAVSRLQPRRTLLVGAGADGLAAATLSLTAAWDGLVDLAWPTPADGQPPRDGHRFTMHAARPQDAAGLMPVPGLVIVEPGDPSASGPVVAGVLNALKTQARRTGKPYPLVLLLGVTAAGAAAGPPQGEDPRPPSLAALEDFVTAEAPALIYAVLPLLDGAALLTARAQLEHEAVRTIFAGVAMGAMTRLAAAEAETARMALRAEAARLRDQCADAEIRTHYLYAALLRARADAAAQPDAPAGQTEAGPDTKRAPAPRRVLGKLLQAASGRRPGAADAARADEAAIARVRQSPILSASWYTASYPDVAASGMDPAEHYTRFGAAEGRDPGPDFVTAFYLACAPDAARPGVNPLLHFLEHGGRQGVWPNPDFDPAFYLAANPDVAEAGLNPLEHFAAQGRAEGRRGLPPR